MKASGYSFPESSKSKLETLEQPSDHPLYLLNMPVPWLSQGISRALLEFNAFPFQVKKEDAL